MLRITYIARLAPWRRMYSLKFNEQVAGPPRLPKEDQEEFEMLQKVANSQAAIEAYNNDTEATTSIGVLPAGVFKTVPDFDGDVNPVTGERGGPKQDPLKASPNDWSFNGRVTDF